MILIVVTLRVSFFFKDWIYQTVKNQTVKNRNIFKIKINER